MQRISRLILPNSVRGEKLLIKEKSGVSVPNLGFSLFQGRLNELMSQMRMQNQLAATRQDATYQMDSAVQLEIRQVKN